jgi:hypothetical protein
MEAWILHIRKTWQEEKGDKLVDVDSDRITAWGTQAAAEKALEQYLHDLPVWHLMPILSDAVHALVKHGETALARELLCQYSGLLGGKFRFTISIIKSTFLGSPFE